MLQRVEKHIENGRMEAAYVKRFFGKTKIRGSDIEGEDKQLLYGQGKIAIRWK